MQSLSSRMVALIEERSRLEKKARELTSYLTAPGMPGLKGGLDDAEGYPRADIDIIGIVNARHELACLNTDYNNLMKEIEKELQEIHSQSKVYVERESNLENLRPFGQVSSVTKNSPGDLCGLMPDDLILKFGVLSLQQGSLETLFDQLPTFVRNKLDQAVPVVVKRNGKISTLMLTPAIWSGQGLLGFRLEPYVP
eukprot:Gregarina_sp_Poly_1__6341@NODE_3379_length_1140_cov_55_887232_g2138_i0_p1_GENE_NODE_3379_length_1140_cov_55_887232_g2138_i0NODE_3379_length_1140_cov_55_887232_g2138_i0_p1_ORF_typecomplete_len196_score26_02Nas2_N/PF18265_1/1_4e24GRASP55_65/PF04495_14/3_2e03GRASP55_65/PF04495_14/1_6e07PDZ_6/PF17820_1/3_4e05PDZ_2/PF13180_6/7_1e05DUF29/PF01724_16/0_085DUF5497/PF17601_2/0_1ATPsynt_E_2/PF08112_11/2_6e02ATPsynt_E_2/PF08112_11/0_2ATPsynt_E_2/PF08112_11/1_8e04CENPF_leu_zip/PF10473_9/4_7e02CENPF_leu_zip/P